MVSIDGTAYERIVPRGCYELNDFTYPRGVAPSESLELSPPRFPTGMAAADIIKQAMNA